MSITGNPGGEPVRCGVSVGDLSAALYGIIAILSALRVRDRDGVGNHVDIAMLDCQVAMLEDALARYSVSGKIPGRLGTRHPSITPFQQFRAADDYFVMGAGDEFLSGSASATPLRCRSFRRTIRASPLTPIVPPTILRSRRFSRYFCHPAARPLAASSHRRIGAVRADRQRRGVSASLHLAARNMILHAEHSSFDGLIVSGLAVQRAGDQRYPLHQRAPPGRGHRHGAGERAGLRFFASIGTPKQNIMGTTISGRLE